MLERETYSGNLRVVTAMPLMLTTPSSSYWRVLAPRLKTLTILGCERVSVPAGVDAPRVDDSSLGAILCNEPRLPRKSARMYLEDGVLPRRRVSVIER